MKWIKNNLVHHDKPTTLSDLQKLVQAINSHYWECKAEISCEDTSSTSRNKSENKSYNSKSEKGKGSSKSKQKDLNSSSSSTSSKGSSSEPKKSNPNLSSKLGVKIQISLRNMSKSRNWVVRDVSKNQISDSECMREWLRKPMCQSEGDRKSVV